MQYVLGLRVAGCVGGIDEGYLEMKSYLVVLRSGARNLGAKYGGPSG